MVENRTHKAVLRFLKKILDVPAGYSREDLTQFRSIASKQYPSLLPLVEDYLRLAEQSETKVPMQAQGSPKKIRRPSEEMHLFDLLREKRLFASNSDLANFAASVLPGIKGNRFDKMSRGDIAARIIEFLETKDDRTRRALELSMREAMDSTNSGKAVGKSFLSKWERIIKGIQL